MSTDEIMWFSIIGGIIVLLWILFSYATRVINKQRKTKETTIASAIIKEKQKQKNDKDKEQIINGAGGAMFM
jgi:hypothetical protein